jgi:predicted nuclease with TOPRIM domain
MLKINELEDKIRNLEIENQKYAEQFQKIVNDKAELMQTINDFTERMAFSFSTKTTSPNLSE